MTYEYTNVKITLENNEVYWLWDIISFALDYDVKEKVLTDEKRAFAKKLTDILNEMK